ncbi:low-CO2 inducible [Micractinium conductrix]|uniref:Low-CO2 inducible n=1 Tax=Micractinium conductrix TaxID=554055 RepID=A0A2P6V7P4_9CHLO|nr:low-CO2 inducible [Micractinium conductrix]|eukprot:PSC70098.1 low-CO2 inducible [Micractinium conductrix]
MAAFALSRAAGAQPTQSARPQGLVRGPARQFTSSRNVQAAFWGRKKKAPEPAPEVPAAAAAEEKAAAAPAAAAPAAAAATSEVAAGENSVLDVNGRMIVVEANGTIIIGAGPQGAGKPAAVDVREAAEVEYLTARSAIVNKHFEGSLGADDFIQRVEMALYAFGFTGENSIAMVNLCRDEVTVTLKQKIDAVFGASFSTNGLGGVLTCGAVGMGAGFSHSPICDTTGKERYIFFSFPHISINSKGEVGPMSRPGRPGQSCACGALIKSWTELRSEGVSCNCKIPGVHDAENPEYSILKQRIARRLRHEGETDESVQQLSLVDITKVAERTISDDLEYLISKTVDTNKADYAVITGVQVHNWAFDFEDDSPNLEFVFPTSTYVVVDGNKTHIDIAAMPPMTPRQIRLVHGGDDCQVVCNTGGQSTLRAEDSPYAYDSKDARKVQKSRLQNYISLMKNEGLDNVAVPTPVLQKKLAIGTPARCATADNSTIMDQRYAKDAELQELQKALEKKYQSLPASPRPLHKLLPRAMPRVLAATAAQPAMAMQQRASAAPKRSAATGARALVAHPAACRCAAHRRGRSLVVRAASDNVMEVGGRTIVVEDDGTIIISQPAASAAVDVKESAEVEYLTARSAIVNKHFEGSLGADDFIQRVEMALYAFGFTGENSIAMVNLCRDEVTVTLKQKIDAVFGASFSTNGLGGVLTCGAVGMGAGFSHSPICDTTGKERYIFFSFPHISINSKGEVGPMSRPGRPGQSCACGALIKSWTELRSEGVSCNCKIPGVHDAENPEYSILKQRIARRLRHEGETDESVQQLSLVDITKVAERTISDDLEYLISKTVDTNKADYAVITGVQVHNWAFDFEDDSPNLEFVFPTSAYVVVDGVKTHVDLAAMPPLTPRQIRLVHGGDQGVVCNTGGQSTLRAEDPPYAYDSKDARKVQRTSLQNYISLIKDEGLESVAAAPSSPAWAKQITKSVADRTNSTALDMKFAQNEDLKEMQAQLEAKYQSL